MFLLNQQKIDLFVAFLCGLAVLWACNALVLEGDSNAWAILVFSGLLGMMALLRFRSKM